MLALKIVLLVIGAYLVGNFNAAVVISKLKKNDIRKLGSGNPGAVNMIRNFGNGWGAVTLAADVLKGVIPALTGWLLLDDTLGIYIGGISVMLGHMFPAVFKFKGGKGVATVIGIYLVANWWVSLIVFAIAVVYVIFFHYGFVASFIIVTSMTIVEIIWGTASELSNIARIVIIVVLFLAIIIAHRTNIVRLFKGTENKIYIIKKLKPKEAVKEPEKAETVNMNGDAVCEETAQAEKENPPESENNEI